MGVQGVASMSRAAAMPALTGPGRVEVLRSVLLPDDRAESAAFKIEYWREVGALNTGKWRLLERGRGFVVLAGAGLAAVLLLRLWDARNLARVRTPRSARSFLLLGVLAWVGLVPAEWIALLELAGRGHLPYWADSAGLPMLSWAFVVLAPLPVVVGLAWFGVLRRARLPASLWTWDRARPVRNLFWIVACAALALFFAALLARAVELGVFLAVPLAAVLVYLALSARAAALSGLDAVRDIGAAPP